MTSQRTESRPRLLVLASTYPRWSGDPEPGFVHELARRLVDGFDVTVLCPHAEGAATDESMDGVRVRRYRYAPARLETLVNDGGIVTNLRRRPWKWLLVPGFVLGQWWALLKALRDPGADVIHAHWLLPQGLVVALMRRFGKAPPFMVTSHGADLFALRARPFGWLKGFVAAHAATVTVVSTAMRDELAATGADPGKVVVQSMGVDLGTRFTPDASVERSRHEILFVGRFVEKKGLRVLLDAMPAVLAEHPGARLTVAGFGPESEERLRQVARLGLQHCVRFVGAVSQAELPALYRRAALLAAPFVPAAGGDRDGLGLVLVEALGCGCPVVTTALPSARDVFGPEGAAQCVEPGSAPALARAVCGILQEPGRARARALAARSALASRFDWTATATAYGRMLAALANR